MHLSLLSDGFLSDSLDEACPAPMRHDLGRVHRDGLLRGLLVIVALALPLGLTLALAPAGAAKVAAPTPGSLRVVHLHMS